LGDVPQIVLQHLHGVQNHQQFACMLLLLSILVVPTIVDNDHVMVNKK